MSNYKHQPLIGLLEIKQSEISNADIVDAFNYAEEKINASPKGRAKELALLFYFINLLNKINAPFYIKGGIILQYYLKDKARETRDIDVITPLKGDEFKKQLEESLSLQEGPLTFKIANYKVTPADEYYYYDTFNIELEALHNDQPYSKVVIDGVTSPIFDRVKPLTYEGPEIIAKGFKFQGVPVEYVMAEKVIAISNELKRPFKHLIDVYGLIHIDINVSLLKEFCDLINEHDNQIRAKLNKETMANHYQIKADKPFVSNYIMPLLQAGYNIPYEEMREEVNKWLNTIKSKNKRSIS